MLNDREWATVILVAAAAVTVALVPKLRQSISPSLKQLFVAAFTPKVVAIFVGFLVWVAVFVSVASVWRVWQIDLLKDSIIVVLGLGFPLLFKAVEAPDGATIGRSIRRGTISRGAFLAFYLNLEALPLQLEIALQLVLLVVAITTARGIRRQIAAGFFYLIVFLGLSAWTVNRIATTWQEADLDLAIRTLAMTVWLPLTMFPYLYGTALFAHLELAFLRLCDFGKRRLGMRTRLGVLIGLRFSVRWSSQLNGSYSDIGKEKTLRGTLSKMSDFRDDVERRDGQRADKLATLEANIGVDGVDEQGARLDRQEFKVTKDRLEWIWTTQIGRYSKNGDRYWDNLTDMMVDPLRYGLPIDHGFVTQITPDGQRWRSWRRTPSGWVLGIGGIDVGSQYVFEGPTAPTSWPGQSTEWVNTAIDPWPPDWRKYDGPL